MKIDDDDVKKLIEEIHRTHKFDINIDIDLKSESEHGKTQLVIKKKALLKEVTHKILIIENKVN